MTKSVPIKVKRALLSAYKPELILPLAIGLQELGVELWASSGTHSWLKSPTDKQGNAKPMIMTHSTEEMTGIASWFGGRVKTLHPKLHGMILAPHTPEGIAEAEREGIPLLDMVVVNAYPFAETRKNPDATYEQVNEKIDVGGPSMLRGAVKNREWVIPLTVTDGSLDAGMVLAELRAHDGTLSHEICEELARKTIMFTLDYDINVLGWMRGTSPGGLAEYVLFMPNGEKGKYGENPHQGMAVLDAVLPVSNMLNTWPMKFLKGGSTSWSGYLDLDYAINSVVDISAMADGGAAAIVTKHAIPCGGAIASTPEEAVKNALATDGIAKYGCTIALSVPAAEGLAEAMRGTMVDALAGPGFSPGLMELLQKRKTKVIEVKLPGANAPRLEARTAAGRLIVQQVDQRQIQPDKLTLVTEKAATPEQLRLMEFAWKMVRGVRSNAIVVVDGKELKTVGVGSGQPSRVAAARGAIDVANYVHLDDSIGIETVRKAIGNDARKRTDGAVAASDAFFPFPDGLELLAKAGVGAVIHPGGSKYDQLSVDIANKYGMAMYYTGYRVFRH